MAFKPNPTTSPYSSYNPMGPNPAVGHAQQLGGRPQGGQMRRPGGVQGNVVGQVNNTNVSTNNDILGLVDSLAAKQQMASGVRAQARGDQLSRTNKWTGRKSGRNALAGSIIGHRGNKRVNQAIETEAAYQTEQERQAKAEAEALFQEKMGQAAMMVVQRFPNLGRDEVLAASKLVATGQIALKDLPEFFDIEEKEVEAPSYKTRTVMRPDGSTYTEEYVAGEGGQWESGIPEAPDEKDSPFSAAEQAKARTAWRGTQTANTSIDEYIKHIEDNGRAILPGTKERARAKALESQLLVSLKDSFELGALQGPDIELLRGLNPDLSEGFRAATALTQLQQLKKHMGDRQGRISDLYPMDVLSPAQEETAPAEGGGAQRKVLKFDKDGNPIE